MGAMRIVCRIKGKEKSKRAMMSDSDSDSDDDGVTSIGERPKRYSSAWSSWYYDEKFYVQ